MLEALQSNHRQEMAAQIPDKLGPVVPPVGQGSSLADPIIIIIWNVICERNKRSFWIIFVLVIETAMNQ